jgi:hypothetical protein
MGINVILKNITLSFLSLSLEPNNLKIILLSTHFLSTFFPLTIFPFTFFPSTFFCNPNKALVCTSWEKLQNHCRFFLAKENNNISRKMMSVLLAH